MVLKPRAIAWNTRPKIHLVDVKLDDINDTFSDGEPIKEFTFCGQRLPYN